MISRFFVVSAIVAVIPLMADTIVPGTYSASIAVGGTATIHKTVTITQTATAPVDVFFLTDTTGSMFDAIDSVRTGFAGIVSALTPIATDIQWGVGDYKDFSDPYAYQLDQNITDNVPAVQSALSSLSADGGGDYQEANLYALQQTATTTGWRAGSQRFLLWTGDASGHDPSGGVTEPNATAALVGAGIKTFAISVGFGGLDDTGQATRITAATGGNVISGGYSEAADIIKAALTTSLTTYSNVSLGMAPITGLDVSIVPGAGYTGAFDRSIERTFDFDVVFTGLAPGTYSFGINALLDGAAVATERDTIVVGGSVPEPSTWMTVLLGVGALVGARRWRSRG